jgi:uncharacterized protein
LISASLRLRSPDAVKKFLAALLAVFSLAAFAGETVPPAPKLYFNDYAGVVSSATATRLNKTLEDFERETSSQVVVAVFQKMESDSSIEDYTVRVAQSWKAGQKGKDNGAVLFVFIQDRKMFLQVGYGLEGALPDALCKRIIEDEIKPRFRNNDYDAGLTAGVTAILAATKGEYKGSGRTVAVGQAGTHDPMPKLFLFLILFMVIGIMFSLGRRGRRSGWIISSGGWSSGGSGWGGGGFSSGGGGFSGGGGSFGGGGAGGSW